MRKMIHLQIHISYVLSYVLTDDESCLKAISKKFPLECSVSRENTIFLIWKTLICACLCKAHRHKSYQ